MALPYAALKPLFISAAVILALAAASWAAAANWQTALPVGGTYARDGVQVSISGISQSGRDIEVAYALSGPPGTRAAAHAFAFVDGVMERDSGGPAAANPEWKALGAGPMTGTFSTTLPADADQYTFSVLLGVERGGRVVSYSLAHFAVPWGTEK